MQGVDSELALPCECGCSIVLITEIDEWKEEPREFYVDFYTGYHEGKFRYRLKQAWYLLRADRNKSPMHAVVFHEESIKKLRDFLDGALTK